MHQKCQISCGGGLTMGGFTNSEKCAVPGCGKRAPIIYATAIDPAMILVFCQEHIPKSKVIKEVKIIKGSLKGRKFGLALLYDEEGINWIKKCGASADVRLNISEEKIEVIKK